jgi:pyruvate dehydrogenase E1 component
LHMGGKQKQAYITKLLADAKGPTIAATDYMKQYADQVRAWVPTAYRVLGTDGFGRSDSRENLRRHFEVNPQYIVLAALSELAKAGDIDVKVVAKAIKDFGIDTNKINPLHA